MASSKVMASRSPPPNQDLPTQPSSSPLNLRSGHSQGFGSVNMDDLFRTIYSESDSFVIENNEADGDGGGGGVVGGGMRSENGSKTVDEVWRDIMGGGSGVGSEETRMTLEDFLAKAGAVNEEDVRVTAGGAFGMETTVMNPVAGIPAVQYGSAICVQNGYGVEFGNGMRSASGNTDGGGGSGRGKKRAGVEEASIDKTTQQKQRRMIKNRESAARSRERKQAYTVELESLVAQLEEDNARLLKEEAEATKKRYKQLMERQIPVVEKRRPPKVLGRTQSMEW